LPEYVIYPSHKTTPTPEYLLSEIHRRGWDVELNVKGGGRNWEGIRFFQEGPPEIESYVLHDFKYNRFHVTVPETSPDGKAQDLQLHLVDVLLKTLGGDAENVETRKRFNAPEFASHMLFRKRPLLPFELRTLGWPLFAWLTVGFGAGIALFGRPEMLVPALVITGLAFLAALGLTFDLKKSN
jgi:hypothetical protein